MLEEFAAFDDQRLQRVVHLGTHRVGPPGQDCAGGASLKNSVRRQKASASLTRALTLSRRRAAFGSRRLHAQETSNWMPAASMSLTPDRSSSTSPGRHGHQQPVAPVPGGMIVISPAITTRLVPDDCIDRMHSCVSLIGARRDQGRISLDTAVSICGGWKGLTTHALAPAAWPSRFLSSPASVVSMITGMNL